MIKVYWFDLTADSAVRVKNKTKNPADSERFTIHEDKQKNMAWICLKILSGMLCWFREVYNSGTKACASQTSSVCLDCQTHQNFRAETWPAGISLREKLYLQCTVAYIRATRVPAWVQDKEETYSAYCLISPPGENVKWCQLIQRDS